MPTNPNDPNRPGSEWRPQRGPQPDASVNYGSTQRPRRNTPAPPQSGRQFTARNYAPPVGGQLPPGGRPVYQPPPEQREYPESLYDPSEEVSGGDSLLDASEAMRPYDSDTRLLSGLVTLVAIILMAFLTAFGSIAIFGWDKVTQYWNWVLYAWLCGVALIIFQLVGMSRVRHRRQRSDNGHIERVEYSNLTLEELAEIRYAIVQKSRVSQDTPPRRLRSEEGTVVIRLTTFHFMEWVSKSIVVGLLWIGHVVLAVKLGGYVALAVPFTLIVGLVIVLFRRMLWKHSFYAVTNFFTGRGRVLPTFFWFVPSKFTSIPIQKVDNSSPKETTFGNWWGYGKLTVDGAGDEDGDLHDMKYMPNAQDVDKDIMYAMNLWNTQGRGR